MTQSKKTLTVLVSSIGNKIELLRIWQQVLRRSHGTLIGIDSNPDALARSECDFFVEVPALDLKDFWTAVEEIIKKQSVDLIVPTTSQELIAWSQFKEQNPNLFKKTKLALSSLECLEITLDKRKLHQWLKSQGFPTPFTVEIATLNPREKLPEQLALPCLAKDSQGGGSRETKIIHFKSEIFELPPQWILQSCLDGKEFTLNAYVNREGKCVCLIPHLREKMQNGQVVQATTIKDKILIKLGQEIAEALPQAYGPINIQIIWDINSQSTPYVVDINSRFGGGYPLAHRVGGMYVNWLIMEALGSSIPNKSISWEEGIQFQRIGQQAYFTRAPFSTISKVNI
jgi:carbamoyl-phosphate synthase large subunit